MNTSTSQPAVSNPSRYAAFLNEGIALRIFFPVTFVFIFMFHTYPLGLSDFWWHMNSGRWIWNNGGLPVDDPFLFSSVSPLDARASQILHGYPLFQLLVFGVYALAGTSALVVMKGLLMTLFYGLLWNHLRRNGMHATLALALVGALPLLFFRFDDFRPQVFTFIFTLLVLQLIEHILAGERRGIAMKRYVLLLPLVMLFWANLHGGFIVGMAILLVYVLAEWVARIRRSDALPDAAYSRFLLIAGCSVVAAMLNPAGIAATWSLFTVVSGPFAKVIDEFLGTVRYFEFHGLKHIGYLIVAAAVIPAIALLARWRRLSMPHVLLLSAFLAAGIFSFRFSLLMVALVMAIASAYFSRDLNRWLGAYKGLPMILLWCVSTAFLANSALSRTSLAGTPLEAGVVPVAAAAYLEKAVPEGNLYNYFEYGGYLSWQLYPQKIFIDQRSLSWDTYEEYSRAWRGDYQEVFGKYGVGAVIYPVYEGTTRKVSRLTAGLLNDSLWGVGYYDGHDLVFLKLDINQHLPVLDKQAVVRDIIRRARG
ncbi:MAG: hypothetical protein HY938_06110 [Nitrosomonadales bacterium]|nr:hypothetical protein [Nitrosomonadales bacterium]